MVEEKSLPIVPDVEKPVQSGKELGMGRFLVPILFSLILL